MRYSLAEYARGALRLEAVEQEAAGPYRAHQEVDANGEDQYADLLFLGHRSLLGPRRLTAELSGPRSGSAAATG